MLALLGMFFGVEQITAKLANILEERCLVLDDVVPEMRCRKFALQDDRTADGQRRADRTYTGPIMLLRRTCGIRAAFGLPVVPLV